jgi:hypothetical protein
MRNEEAEPDTTPHDWMYEKMPDVKAPPPRVLYAGPDAMRPGAREGGRGEAFIYFADGTLEWAPGPGHESMLDVRRQGPDKIMTLLAHAFSPEEVKALAQETSYQDEPFFEDRILRMKLQQRALFGRVGSVHGYDMLSLWPGTGNFTTLMPKLVDVLAKDGRITQNTLITVGREARYTVSQFLAKQQEVTAKLQQASNELGDVMGGGQRAFVRGQGDAENMANPERSGGGEHPMSMAMKKAGMIGPGQKWWAPTSESFREYVERRDRENEQ